MIGTTTVRQEMSKDWTISPQSRSALTAAALLECSVLVPVTNPSWESVERFAVSISSGIPAVLEISGDMVLNRFRLSMHTTGTEQEAAREVLARIHARASALRPVPADAQNGIDDDLPV